LWDFGPQQENKKRKSKERVKIRKKMVQGKGKWRRL
jgi:hypothetical protein